MPRDMELIRMILIYVRNHAKSGSLVFPSFAGYEKGMVDYHVMLCEQAGYLQLNEETLDEERLILNLTWAGHEFLSKGK